MLKRHHLPYLSKLGKRSGLPTALIAIDIVKNLGGQNKEATVDNTAVTTRLFHKTCDLVTQSFQRTKATRREHCRHGGKLAMTMVKFDRSTNIDVADAITIGKAETLLVLDVIGNTLKTPTG